MVEADNANGRNWWPDPKEVRNGPDNLAPVSLRLFGGGVATETNVFSPIPTGIDDFVPGAERFAPYVRLAEERGDTYIQGYYGFAQPAGMTTRVAYETLRDRLLDEIREALPLDGVLLVLHGAMVADGYSDCETDLVGRVRAVVGETAKIGVLLDLHCDLAQELIDTADVVITYKEYPHVDIDERATEVGRLVAAAASGEIAPVMAVHDCRLLGVYVTPLEPMRSFVDRMTEIEQRPGVLSVSLGHSFPWGDSTDMGVRTLVVADGDEALARSVAGEVGRDFFAIRREAAIAHMSLTDALDHAFSLPQTGAPVVVADIADNAGGGAPSDSTFVLRELLERRATSVALAMVWDPIVVQQAFAAGVGASLRVRLGGKMGVSSGDPLDLDVTVEGLVPELVERWPQTGGAYIDWACGDAAWLRAGGVDVIVNSTRVQVKGLEPFTAFGIDPASRHVLVVKSTNHFRAAFEPIASEIVYMSAPGALTFDFTSIPYRHLDTGKYPWLEDPWQT
jgi:microcystin degradation protein MlrC